MNVVDSSGWIEFLTAGPNGTAFKAIIQETGQLIPPSALQKNYKKIQIDKNK